MSSLLASASPKRPLDDAAAAAAPDSKRVRGLDASEADDDTEYWAHPRACSDIDLLVHFADGVRFLCHCHRFVLLKMSPWFVTAIEADPTSRTITFHAGEGPFLDVTDVRNFLVTVYAWPVRPADAIAANSELLLRTLHACDYFGCTQVIADLLLIVRRSSTSLMDITPRRAIDTANRFKLEWLKERVATRIATPAAFKADSVVAAACCYYFAVRALASEKRAHELTTAVSDSLYVMDEFVESWGTPLNADNCARGPACTCPRGGHEPDLDNASADDFANCPIHVITQVRNFLKQI